MIRFPGIAGIFVLAVATACGGSDLLQPPGPSLPIIRLASQPYSFTFYSGLEKPARFVVRDAAAWQTIWNHIYLRQSPVPPLPSVDFSRDMIVVVALGARPTGGYGILIDGASESANDAVEVIVDSSSPASSCVLTEALTQPVDIARVPLRDGAVTFVERSHETTCE
jgi:protease stability complex PrcB-like protein